MKTVDLMELSNMPRLEISSLFSMKQFWKEGHTYVMKAPRKQNALLWFCGAEGRFSFSNGNILVETVEVPKEFYLEQERAFVDAIKGERAPLFPSIADGAQGQRVVDAILRSAAERRWIVI